MSFVLISNRGSSAPFLTVGNQGLFFYFSELSAKIFLAKVVDLVKVAFLPQMFMWRINIRFITNVSADPWTTTLPNDCYSQSFLATIKYLVTNCRHNLQILSKSMPVFAGLVLDNKIYFISLFLSKYLSKSACDLIPIKAIIFNFFCLKIKLSKSFGSSSLILSMSLLCCFTIISNDLICWLNIQHFIHINFNHSNV